MDTQVDEGTIDLTTGEPEGLSRRSLMKRGAIVGGALVWAAPMVQTIARPAFAATSPPPTPGGISFVALIINCGGTTYRIKFDAGATTPECGTTFAADACVNQLQPGNVASGCPSGVTATWDPNSGVTVSLGSCTLTDYIIKQGTCCLGPTSANNGPATGSSGDVFFPNQTQNQCTCDTPTGQRCP